MQTLSPVLDALLAQAERTEPGTNILVNYEELTALDAARADINMNPFGEISIGPSEIHARFKGQTFVYAGYMPFRPADRSTLQTPA